MRRNRRALPCIGRMGLNRCRCAGSGTERNERSQAWCHVARCGAHTYSRTLATSIVLTHPHRLNVTRARLRRGVVVARCGREGKVESGGQVRPGGKGGEWWPGAAGRERWRVIIKTYLTPPLLLFHFIIATRRNDAGWAGGNQHHVSGPD